MEACVQFLWIIAELVKDGQLDFKKKKQTKKHESKAGRFRKYFPCSQIV